MNVLLVCALWVCMLGGGICWFFLPCIDVSVVCWPTVIWFTCLFSSPWPILKYNFFSIGVYSRSYKEFWMCNLCLSYLV
jgi:hypothetical protein